MKEKTPTFIRKHQGHIQHFIIIDTLIVWLFYMYNVRCIQTTTDEKVIQRHTL